MGYFFFFSFFVVTLRGSIVTGLTFMVATLLDIYFPSKSSLLLVLPPPVALSSLAAPYFRLDPASLLRNSGFKYCARVQ